MAQELHDEVGQTLTAVLLQLSRVHGRLDGELGPVLGEAQDAVRASLEDVRRIATELRPETLAELGLVSALATLSENFSRRTGILVSQELEPDTAGAHGGDGTGRLPRRAGGAHERRPPRRLRAHRPELVDGTGRLTLIVRDYGCGLTGPRARRERHPRDARTRGRDRGAGACRAARARARAARCGSRCRWRDDEAEVADPAGRRSQPRAARACATSSTPSPTSR